jgi:polyhydroxyalkanoate synthesis regulator phasin
MADEKDSGGKAAGAKKASKPATKKPAKKAAASSTKKPAATGTKKSAPKKPAAKKAAPKSAPKSGAKSTAKKPAAKKAPRGTVGLDKSIAQLRDSLEHSVTLSRDRIQEVVDDAVKRGRMTHGDAEKMIGELLKRGRKQTDTLLSELEKLVRQARRKLP